MHKLIQTLFALIGLHAQDLLSLLSKRDADLSRAQQAQAWTAELAQAQARWGSAAPAHTQTPTSPTHTDDNGRLRITTTYRASTAAGACHVWAQHLRSAAGLPLRKYSADPLWLQTSRYLHASHAGKAQQAAARAACAARYGLTSTTHLPASCFAMALDAVLLSAITGRPAPPPSTPPTPPAPKPTPKPTTLQAQTWQGTTAVYTARSIAQHTGCLHLVVQQIVQTLPGLHLSQRAAAGTLSGTTRGGWICSCTDLPAVLGAVERAQALRKGARVPRLQALAAPAPTHDAWCRYQACQRSLSAGWSPGGVRAPGKVQG